MYHILKQIAVTGIKTEPAPAADEALRTACERLHADVLQYFSGALTIRGRPGAYGAGRDRCHHPDLRHGRTLAADTSRCKDFT